ncbi:MAG TPA: DUF58 domain-containing protein [Capsulimonadaceae bacterium]|nr:DUF58 domain-containing protein [Capsulimonadaceae bacterium]
MPIETTSPYLLEAAEMNVLSGMKFAPRRSFTGRTAGERVSRKKGVSLEFADYRDYAAGDDLRHLDWTILARLDRPTIRTYQDEDDLAVYIALDTSGSMDFGEPTKFSHASRLAAAMGFVGLVGQDTVYGQPLGGRQRPPGRPFRGRASFRALSDWLAALRPEGHAGLAQSLIRFGTSGGHRPGLFVCVTDGLDPGVESGLRAVASRGFEIALIQVLSPIELDPDLEGDLRLLDAESSDPVEVTANRETLRVYKANLAEHCRRLEEATVRLGGRFFQSVVGQPLVEFITRDVRRAQLVR